MVDYGVAHRRGRRDEVGAARDVERQRRYLARLGGPAPECSQMKRVSVLLGRISAILTLMSSPQRTGSGCNPPIRGLHTSRGPDFMQQLQLSYVNAIAAAAGCVVSQPTIDDGIDIDLRSRHPSHTAFSDQTARLEVQLKSTASKIRMLANHVSTKMRFDRYNYYAAPPPLSVHKIVLIMPQPSHPGHWTYVRPKGLTLHYACYWVNIAGQGHHSQGHIQVKAPRTQVFDDLALCGMMERIGRGEAP